MRFLVFIVIAAILALACNVTAILAMTDYTSLKAEF